MITDLTLLFHLTTNNIWILFSWSNYNHINQCSEHIEANYTFLNGWGKTIHKAS